MKAAFWVAVIGIGIPLYAYILYPIILFVLAAFVQTGRDLAYLVLRSDRRRRSERRPKVSIILAAYNEEQAIERTIRNCLAADYPRDRVEIIIGSDASTDRTVEIARRFQDQGVRVLAFPERRGKLAVISDCAQQATGDILVLSDANSLLDASAVRLLVRHFENPAVGAVCGELRLTASNGTPADEGFYWRYEVILKTLESRMDSALGANGAIYAIRRELFPNLSTRLITDDFVIPMKVRSRGFRVLYDPEATATEEAPAGVSDEFHRRMRIGAGNWQALWHCANLLLPWKGFVSFAFWSHKVLRWFSPFLMAAALVANVALISDPIWRIVLWLQVAFYGTAALGYTLGRLRLPAGPFRIISYFVAINLALGIGLIRGVLGLQSASWRRTAREQVQPGGHT